MAENTQTVFRKKSLDRIASPEQLTDYLRVTNPGIWVILLAVILLLAGVFAWSMVGTLETKAAVKVVVSDHTAQVISLGPETLGLYAAYGRFDPEKEKLFLGIRDGHYIGGRLENYTDAPDKQAGPASEELDRMETVIDALVGAEPFALIPALLKKQ